MRRTAGIGRYAESLVAAMRDLDAVDVRVSTPWWPPPREDWALRFLNAQPAALASLRHRPAVVHSLDANPVLGFPLRRQVATVHDVIPWTRSPRHRHVALYLRAQRARLRRCGAVVTVSAAARGEVIDTLDLDPSRVHAIPNGVASTFTAEPGPEDERLRREAGVATTGYVLWVGSLGAHDPRKALDGLLAAMAAIADLGLALVMVGRHGAESDRLVGGARSLGVELVLPGFVSDASLAAIYRGARVVTLPSLHEGFGLPALEAMASAAPLVATRAGNLVDLVGEAGLLVPPGDAGELANALRAAATDDTLRERLVAAGPARAAGHSWRRAAEQTVEVYRRVAEQPID
jgi:glycosyltransferase involved in cell wall biosynthesis